MSFNLKNISFGKLGLKKEKIPLPKVTLPFDESLKKTQERYLFSFIILFFFAGLYSYFYAEEQVQKNEIIEVLVWKKDIILPQEIKKSDLEKQSFARHKLPESFFENFESVEGQSTVRVVRAHQIIMPDDVRNQIDPEAASSQFDDFLAFTMDATWFEATLPALSKNDLIDLLVTNPKEGLAQTSVIASRIRVIAVDKNLGGDTTLLVNITETEAQNILFARGLKLPMQVLLHSSILPKGEDLSLPSQ